VAITIIAAGLAVNAFKPWPVVLIPLNRAGQPFGEIPASLPAQRGLELAAVQCVPAVVPRPVRDELNERARFPEDVRDSAGNLDIPQLAFAADVVHLGVRAPVQDEVESAAMVLDVNPVSSILPIAVNRPARSSGG